MAQLVARENAIANKAEFPLASEAILESTYMDDTLDSVEDEVVGKEIYRELKDVWGRAGMSPRKWLSNSEEVLKEIPVAERAASVDLENSELPSSKTLGVRWNAKDDVFTFSFLIPDNRVFTKRTFLALTAAIFDPLGFLAPFIIIAKIESGKDRGNLQGKRWTSPHCKTENQREHIHPTNHQTLPSGALQNMMTQKITNSVWRE